ncbi:hypothetical protein C6A85_16140, partial [Mycobacterium sp. ITM-2017-0098]
MHCATDSTVGRQHIHRCTRVGDVADRRADRHHAEGFRGLGVDYDHVAVLCTMSLEIVDALKVDARPSCAAQGLEGSRLFIAD